MSAITLTEYVRRFALDPATVRLTADRGSFHSARKQDGDWMIDETETYPDKRLRRHEASIQVRGRARTRKNTGTSCGLSRYTKTAGLGTTA